MKKPLMLVILGAALSVGCVDADFSLILDGPIEGEGSIDDNGTPDDPSDDVVTCAFTASTGPDGAENVITTGVDIDTAELAVGQVGQDAPGLFSMAVSIANQLQASDEYSPIGFDQNQRLDQNGVVLSRITMRAEGDTLGVIDERELGLTGLAGTNDGAFAIVRLIDGANFEQRWGPAGQVVGSTRSETGTIELQAFGTTSAGDEVESNLLRIPFRLCSDCALVTSPLCTVND